MGDRANIRVVEEQGGTLYFYTHWSGTELPATLAVALDAGRGRWNDESYLSRIIFSRMVREDIDGETGYGLSTYRGDFEHEDLVVHMREQSVTDRDREQLPFEQFIDKHLNGDVAATAPE